MTSGRKRALILSPECPYPIAGGGALRTASLVEYFSRRYETDVLTFREPGGDDPMAEFRRAGFTGRLHVIDLPVHSRAFAARAFRNAVRAARGVPSLIDRFGAFDDQVERVAKAGGYDLCVIEHFWCAPYLEDLRPYCPRIWMDLHNIESVLQDRAALAQSWPVSTLYRRFANRYRLFERVWLPSFDTILATSNSDAAYARSQAPDVRVLAYPNAIPVTPRPQVEEENVLAISGNFAYGPNIDGLSWFLREIWPRIQQQIPDATLRLIGKNPDAVRRLIQGVPRVESTGAVEDAVREIARSRIALAPLVSGSGTRLKIIEAWAAGRAVVSTTVGAEGLAVVSSGEGLAALRSSAGDEERAGAQSPAGERGVAAGANSVGGEGFAATNAQAAAGGPGAARNANIAIADKPAAFAAEVLRLWKDGAARDSLGAAGRATFERHYTWNAAWRVLDQAEGTVTSTA